MTEEPIPGIRPLTIKEAGDFIFEQLNKRDYSCPVCGEKSFILAYVDAPGGSFLPYQLVASLAPTHSFATVPLVCETCGYVTFFSHKVIGDKLKKPA